LVFTLRSNTRFVNGIGRPRPLERHLFCVSVDLRRCD